MGTARALVPVFLMAAIASGTYGEACLLRKGQSKLRGVSTINGSDNSEHPTVVTKDRARQGVTGHHVRYVLGFGLAAVVIAFAVIYLVYFG